MLKISDFAQIAHVSISALRYYDEIGIFQPIQVDTDTGYRYYSIEQLRDLNRILTLKDLGISLRKITELLNDELPTDALHSMLQLRQAQLQHDIEDAQDQLARVEARLAYIEQGDSATIPDVVIKPIDSAFVVASMTHSEGFVPNWTYAQSFLAALKRHQVEPQGFPNFIYHFSPRTAFDIELAIPIDTASTEQLNFQWDTDITTRELDATPTMACVVHHGTPYRISDAYHA